MHKPLAIIIYGPPCVGKTSLCKMISEYTGYNVFGTDLIRREYFLTRSDLYSPDTTNVIYNMLINQIKETLLHQHSVIIEGMFLTNKTRARILDLFEIAELKLVYVTADLTILRERLSKRSDNVLHNKVPLSIEDLNRFYSLSVPPKDKNLIIDTSKDTIQQSFSLVERIINRSFSYEMIGTNLILSNG